MNQRRGSGCAGCGAAGAVLAVVAVVLVILALGYFGFMPGVSTMFGGDKPRDLGVRFTQADLESYHAKRQGQVVLMAPGAPPASSMAYAGSVDVRTSYTSEELTPVAAERAGQWAYWPITDWQIKIGQDGTVESSGMETFQAAFFLQTGQSAAIDAVLKLKGTATEVTVTADALPLLVTTTPSLATVVERERIEQLPLNGRFFQNLIAQTTPGVEGAGNAPKVFGLRASTMEFTQDGASLVGRNVG